MPYGLVGKKPKELAGKLINGKRTKVQSEVITGDRNEELDERGLLKMGKR